MHAQRRKAMLSTRSGSCRRKSLIFRRRKACAPAFCGWPRLCAPEVMHEPLEDSLPRGLVVLGLAIAASATRPLGRRAMASRSRHLSNRRSRHPMTTVSPGFRRSSAPCIICAISAKRVASRNGGNRCRPCSTQRRAPSRSGEARLTAAYNRGYRSFASVYTSCTPAAVRAEQNYRNEGATLATEITARFGN